MPFYTLIATLMFCSSLALANEGGEKKTDAHGGGGHGKEKKADAHGGGGHGGGHEEAPAAPPPPLGPKREYNPGKITKFPGFTAQLVGTAGGAAEFKPQKGRAAIIIFLASWCDPCQVLMGEFKQIARKYAQSNTDIYFVFAHDTKEDAAGFVKEHQLTTRAVMANNEVLQAFKNPELPSIYISDRWGYMADRFINTKKTDIDKVDVVMSKITAL